MGLGSYLSVLTYRLRHKYKLRLQSNRIEQHTPPPAGQRRAYVNNLKPLVLVDVTQRHSKSSSCVFLHAGQPGAQDLPVWALWLQGQQDGDPGGWCAHPLGAWLLWQSGQREGARRIVSTGTCTHVHTAESCFPQKSVNPAEEQHKLHNWEINHRLYVKDKYLGGREPTGLQWHIAMVLLRKK